MHLWTRLDGKSAPNPVRDAILPEEAEAEERGLPYGLIRFVLRLMPFSMTWARLQVMAATGFELVVPDDVPTSRLPTPDELRLLDEVIDLSGTRFREVPDPQ